MMSKILRLFTSNQEQNWPHSVKFNLILKEVEEE